MNSRFRIGAALACLSLAGRLAAQTITEFPTPTLSSSYSITAGPDGAMWFTEHSANQIGRITLDGVVTEFPLPNAYSGPYGIVAGPDGNLWFLEQVEDVAGNLPEKIGRITPSGVVTEFPIPTINTYAGGIAAGPDGNLWFTEGIGNNIGRITTAGVITEFSIPTPSNARGIATGPDGNLWFAEDEPGKIGRITTAGVVTEFPMPTADGRPNGVAAGSDGNLWFTDVGTGKIGRITTAGVITEFPMPTTNSFPDFGIAAGPDGNLWFTEDDKIGRITTAGAVTEFPTPTGISGTSGIAAGPDGNLWFTESNAIGRIATNRCGQDARLYCLDIGAGALDVASGAEGRTRLLTWDADRLSVRTQDGAGIWTSTPLEGPFSGWNAAAITDGSDGLSRVLWRNQDGRFGVEYLGSTESVRAVRFAAEPGWTAIDISAGSDGNTHLLRTSVDGRARITSVPASGSPAEGPTYGPYGDWSARAMADGPDGATWVLWRRENGETGIARYRDGVVEAAFRWSADPGWTAEDVTVGADGQPRRLRANTDGRMEVSTVGPQGELTATETYNNDGFEARRIASSPDGFTRVLWTAADGTGVLYSLRDPVGPLAGAWTGTFHPADTASCSTAEAQVGLEQYGSRVTGTLSSTGDCPFSVTLLGYFSFGEAFFGTLSGAITSTANDRFPPCCSSVLGLLRDSNLILALTDSRSETAGGLLTLQNSSAVEPTPIPADIAGSWTGTATATHGFCQNAAASAVIEQQDWTVTGTLTSEGCGFQSLHFRGSVWGSDLTVTINGGRPAGPWFPNRVTGTASGTDLHFTVSGDVGFDGPHRTVQMDLRQ